MSAKLHGKTDKEPMPLDFYETPAQATRALLEFLDNNEDWESLFYAYGVTEPFCGREAISEVLFEDAIQVWSTDVHDYGYDRMMDKVDFFSPDFNTNYIYQTIITNPPYSGIMPDGKRFNTGHILEKCQELFLAGAFLLPVNYLTSNKKRISVIEDYRTHALIFKDRLPIKRDGEKAQNMIPYMWLLINFNSPLTTKTFSYCDSREYLNDYL